MTAPSVDPLLDLNQPELEWKRFERFCLDLVKALPDVRDAHLYGVQGDDQEGIDIHTDLVDGRVRTIQCRRVAKFGKAQAEKTIGDTTYAADEHQVWTTCKLTAPARKVIRAAQGWDAWDVEQISSEVRKLPREVARWLVEDHLGQQERRRVLGPDAELVVALARIWFARTDGNPRALQTNQPLQGRQEELAALHEAIFDPSVTCVLVVGRGGVGKTRLLRAVAEDLADRRMLLVREGVDVGASLGTELPMAPFDLVLDDAHRRQDLRNVLATVFTRDELETLVLATRPHQVEAIRDQLSELGLPLSGVRVLDPLVALSDEEAVGLAEHELDADHRALAARLGELTRDAPAILVLAAHVISRGEVDAESLIASPTLRQEVLARYKEERLGQVDGTVSAAAASRLLSLVAAVQPVDPTARLMGEWFAAQIGETEEVVAAAVGALVAADLLVGPRHRRRVAPDVLGDHLLHQQCVDRNGDPTGRARELVEAVPLDLLGQLMANLAELDWRLGRSGEPRILEEACDLIGARLVAADAWSRERHLEQLVGSAAFLAPWVLRLARQLLDHPARDAQLFGDHVVTDADSRRELVRMLAQAGRNPDCTEAAVRLLWEIGADTEPQPSRPGGDPLDEARQLGDYRRPLHFAETLLAVAEQLTADPTVAEDHLCLPGELLTGLAAREGTTTEMASRAAIRLGSYVVSAEATAELRARLRSLLVELCVNGGERTRPAAAALLGDMLRQPHGYFGQSVAEEQLRQWRPEQLALIRDMDDVLTRSDDPLVAREIRHAVDWHAQHSALRGVKTAVRRLLKAHPPTLDERLADALTHSLARFAVHRIAERRPSALVRELRARGDSVKALLDRLDAAVHRLHLCRPAEHVDVGALLGTLATDPAWALEASEMLIAEPQRPTAAGVGLLLSLALGNRPQATRALIKSLANSHDPALRRLAADHVARLSWFGDPDAPERDIAVRLASDDEPVVVQLMLLAALRCAEDDPELASSIVLTVRDLSLSQLAEDACMVLSHAVPLTEAQWQQILDRLLRCPRVDYWYDQVLVLRASTSWRQVLDHLFARIDERPEDYGYDALPFDGTSEDLLKDHEAERRSALDEILIRLAHDPEGRRAMDLPLLFWSAAGDGKDALAAIGEARATGEARHTAADLVIAAAGRHLFLNNPDWVAAQFEASAAGEPLDDLRGALYGALNSGIKQGVPGEPFPDDVELERKAREHASASPPGSRVNVFWTHLADSVAADMRRQVEEDDNGQ